VLVLALALALVLVLALVPVSCEAVATNTTSLLAASMTTQLWPCFGKCLAAWGWARAAGRERQGWM
jgi:hypothetical protein